MRGEWRGGGKDKDLQQRGSESESDLIHTHNERNTRPFTPYIQMSTIQCMNVDVDEHMDRLCIESFAIDSIRFDWSILILRSVT